MGSLRMSIQNAPPGLEQYPGYFPASKPPFWTKAKVGVASGVLGLMIGVAGASGGIAGADPTDDADAPTAADIAQADVDQGVVDRAVADATTSLQQELDDQDAALREQQERAAALLDEARAEAAETKAQAKVAQQKAVAKAVAAEKARQAASKPKVNTLAGGNDPQFDWCYEANDAGYGPYREGEDPEYYWYDDRDNDGLVCES
jgi:hypothetical protein